MTLGPPPGKQAYDEFQGGFRPVSAPTATAEGENTGPSCRAGFRLTGAQGAVTKWGRGSCPINKILMIETRTEWGADRQEKHLGRLIRRPTAWTTRGGCMSKIRPLYAQVRAKEGKKNHRAEEGSALVGERIFRVVRVGRRERLYDRRERRQEGPPTDAGPARKALAALD